MNQAEHNHIVNILPPQDVSGGVSSDVFSLKNFQHATIIIQAGSTNSSAGTITLEACDNFTPTTHTEMAFTYYSETTAAGDTLGAKTAATSAGFAVSGNDNIFYVIEVDAEEVAAISSTSVGLRISWSSAGGTQYGSAVAILSGARFGGDQSATAIA